MSSVAQKRRPSVTEDPALEHECSACGKSLPRTREYFHTRGHGSDVLVNICKECQGKRDSENKAGKRNGAALALVDPRPVVFDDLGTQASVGWYGDVEYFPITPLLALTKYETEYALLEAIRRDALTRDLPLKARINGLRGAPLWCLPWSHFSAFCLKFGNEQTRPQQERAQRVLEAAFGRTAASNRAAAQHVDLNPVLNVLDDHTRRLDSIERKIDGATRIEILKKQVIRGVVYLGWHRYDLKDPSRCGLPHIQHFLDRGMICVVLGRSVYSGKQRFGEYAKKLREDYTDPLTHVETDDPIELEKRLKRDVPKWAQRAEPRNGCELFWCYRRDLDPILSTWPNYITIETAQTTLSHWQFSSDTLRQATLFDMVSV